VHELQIHPATHKAHQLNSHLRTTPRGHPYPYHCTTHCIYRTIESSTTTTPALCMADFSESPSRELAVISTEFLHSSRIVNISIKCILLHRILRQSRLFLFTLVLFVVILCPAAASVSRTSELEGLLTWIMYLISAYTFFRGPMLAEHHQVARAKCHATISVQSNPGIGGDWLF